MLFTPSPVTNCHTFSDPLPLERDVLYGRPHCSRGFLSGRFCQGVCCLEGFVRDGFCPFPLLSEYMYICYYRKLNITQNFMFHM